MKRTESFDMIKVENVPHTGTQSPKPYKSWAEYWKVSTGLSMTKCAYMGCDESEDLCGAHVRKVQEQDSEWYIIPLCRKHNLPTQREPFFARGTMVSVRKQILNYYLESVKASFRTPPSQE